MNAFQASQDLRQYLDGSFFSWLNRGRRSALWIGNVEETPIATIKTYETQATWTDIQPDDVEIQLSKELRAQPPKHGIELST